MGLENAVPFFRKDDDGSGGVVFFLLVILFMALALFLFDVDTLVVVRIAQLFLLLLTYATCSRHLVNFFFKPPSIPVLTGVEQCLFFFSFDRKTVHMVR